MTSQRIADLATGANKVMVEGVIAELGEPRTVNTKFGQKAVVNAILDDGSGTITLVLWEEQIALVKPNDKVRITNGYVNEWNNALQLNLGKFGTLTVL